MNILILLLVLAIGFIAGSLSVHAYPAWDWKIGGVHDWLRKRVVKAIQWRDRIAHWFVGKKSRA